MSDAQWERAARGMGVVFAALALVAFLVFGEAPKLSDSAEEVASFYRDDGGRVLTGLTLFGLSFVALFWFIGAVANALRLSGEGRLAATAIGLLAAWTGAQAVFAATAAPLAISLADRADPEFTLTLHSLGLAIDNISAFPLAGAILAASVGLARSALLPAWILWYGVATALVIALHATNWAEEGFWSPGGGYVYLVVIAGLLWTVIVSVLLYRAPLVSDPTARPAPTAP